MSSLVPIKSKRVDETVNDDDSYSDSSVNAVSSTTYFSKEERRKSIGHDDSSQRIGNEAAAAKQKRHTKQKHPYFAFDCTGNMNRIAQSAVKLEDDADADDMKYTPVDMESNQVCFTSQEQLKGEETDDAEGGDSYQRLTIAAAAMGRTNYHQPQKEEQPDGDEDLKQQDSVATTAAAEIPIYSLLTSDEDSVIEEDDTEVHFTERAARPRSAWHLFNTAVKGKGLSREQIVRMFMVLLLFSI